MCFSVQTFTTPAGKPASSYTPAISSMDSTPQLGGLMTTVLPAARMAFTFWQPMRKGPFQGRISPTTPQGFQVT